MARAIETFCGPWHFGRVLLNIAKPPVRDGTVQAEKEEFEELCVAVCSMKGKDPYKEEAGE